MQRLEDIRDFFGKPKASTSNEEAGSSKSKSKKMKRVIMLDSDDENEDDSNPVSKKQHHEAKAAETKSKNPPPKTIKLTTADDFFGSATVQQASKPIDEFRKSSKTSKKAAAPSSNDTEASKDVEKATSPPKKKVSPVKSNSLPPDAEVHSNPKFKEALAQLDNDPLLSLKYEEAQVDQIAAKRSKNNAGAAVEKVGENKSPPTVSNSSKNSSSTATPKKNEKAEDKSKTLAAEKTPTPQASTSVKNEETNLSDKKLTSNRSAYWSYQNRAGPQSLGAKKFPRGPDDCLSGKSFVLTGIMESFERDDVKSFIERHGGKVVTTVSSKTSYIVVGREPGESKVSKAEKCGTEKIDEDQLLELVSRHTKGKGEELKNEDERDVDAKLKSTIENSKSYETGKKRIPDKSSSIKDETSPESKAAKVNPEKQATKLECTAISNSNNSAVLDIVNKNAKLETKKSQTPVLKSNSVDERKASNTNLNAPRDMKSNHDPQDSLLWVDKYQAKSIKQIIGQQGDKSNAKKLLYWLQNWHAVFTHKSYRGVPGNKENGLIYRAALLSGVAGIGKTTTATIVCKELGFEMISMNASDTRSQKLLNNVVAETLKSGTLTSLMTSKESSSDVTTSKEAELKHVLIMDEVDGMAGNEDRGGMGELIGLIKKSKIPVICICNDRQHQKVRSLANHCLDLRFQRPRVEQLKSAMMSMCFKEGLKINPNALEQMIIGANQDVRQVIHHLQAWFCMQKPLTYDVAKEKATAAKKDQKMGPFDACRAAFCFGEERRKMTIGNKLDLFFYDYSMMPLFMQENYLQTTMSRGNNKSTLAAISKSADSLTYGDLTSKIIRSTNNWSLLPKVGMYTCVIPGELCQGGMGPFVAFPQWLGQNSKRSKNDRLLQVSSRFKNNVINSRKAVAEAIIGFLFGFFYISKNFGFLQFKEFELYWGAVFFMTREEGFRVFGFRVFCGLNRFFVS